MILFDIDGTLFDPEKFGKLIRAEFVAILGTSEEDLIRANADYYAGLESSADFNPHDITAHLASVFKADRSVLDEVFWNNDRIYKESLFPDAKPCLERLSGKNTLGVFSQGNHELQNRKLQACGIAGFFDPERQFIFSRKLTPEALAILPREALLVDNHHDVAAAVKDIAKTIWLNRKTEDVDPDVKTIHSLSELA